LMEGTQRRGFGSFAAVTGQSAATTSVGPDLVSGCSIGQSCKELISRICDEGSVVKPADQCNATSDTHEEFSMRRQTFFDYSRRALLGASGTLALFAALRPLPIFAQASGNKLRIGIIGSGHIGGAIGGLWVKVGHPVLFSSRHPEELKNLVSGLGPLAQNGTVAQAIAFGDALFFAVPYGALPQLGRDYGGALQGKIVLDACNAVPAR